MDKTLDRSRWKRFNINWGHCRRKDKAENNNNTVERQSEVKARRSDEKGSLDAL